MSELKVGSTIYRRNGDPVEITGETKISWIVGGPHPRNQNKIKKMPMRKGNSGEHWIQFFVNREDALDCLFADRNRHKIGNAVSAQDHKMLRKIADLIGWSE